MRIDLGKKRWGLKVSNVMGNEIKENRKKKRLEINKVKKKKAISINK